jgi:hypothetical protein
MKLIAFALAVVCLVVAALYFALPADSLPSWLPGYEAGMTRTRLKHSIAAAAAGAVLLAVGWFVGRRG